MSDKPVLFVVNLAEGVHARAWLNDLPVHRELTTGPDSMTGGANRWLVPGENALVIEILRAPLPLSDKWGLNMMFYRVINENTDPPELDIIHKVEFPALFRGVPEERRTVPYYYSATFRVDSGVTEPAFQRAPTADFGCDGTPELRQAVQDLYNAIVSHDVDGYIRLTTLRDEELARAFPGAPSASVSRQRDASRKFFSLRPRVKPLNFNNIHFEARAGGRVAHVVGADHEPAIEAIAEDDPSLRLRANLLLTQHAGRWQIFG